MPPRIVWRPPEPRSGSRGAKAHLAETQFSRVCAAGDAHDSAQAERERERGRPQAAIARGASGSGGDSGGTCVGRRRGAGEQGCQASSGRGRS